MYEMHADIISNNGQRLFSKLLISINQSIRGCPTQGVWNRREIQLTRPALPYDHACFTDGTSFE